MMMMMSRVHPFVVFLGSPARILAVFFSEVRPTPAGGGRPRGAWSNNSEREREFWWHGTLFFIFI